MSSKRLSLRFNLNNPGDLAAWEYLHRLDGDSINKEIISMINASKQNNDLRELLRQTITAVLGADVFGNLTRMDNVIDGLPGKLEAVRAELAETQVQIENARSELAAPFAREAELSEKTARLKELNILLNMDQKDNALIDDAPDEEAPERPRSKGMER